MLLRKYGENSVYSPNAIRAKILIDNCQWQVGRDDISFWRTNWCGVVLNPNINGALSVREGIHILPQLEDILTSDQYSRIKMVELDLNEDDQLIFSLTVTGKFSIQRYIAESRADHHEVGWARYAWKDFTPARANAFMWRIFQNALPVDSNIQRKGISLASICVCCSRPAFETLDHQFIHSDLAKAFGEHFAAIVHKQTDIHSIEHFLSSCLHGFSSRLQCGYNVRGLIDFGLWEIWKHRCKLKFEGGTMEPQVVIRITTHHLQVANTVLS